MIDCPMRVEAAVAGLSQLAMCLGEQAGCTRVRGPDHAAFREGADTPTNTGADLTYFVT